MSVSVETVREVAKMFCDKWADRYYAHVVPGKLVATDGRILLSVTREDIEPNREDHHPNPAYIDFALEGEETMLAGREEMQAVTSAVLKAWRTSDEELCRRRRMFDEDPRSVFKKNEDGHIRKCPCCGEEFIDDGYGMYTPFKEWLDENRPDECNMKGVVWIHMPEHESPAPVSVRYLGKAVTAATLLGGADSLSVLQSGNAFPQFVLRGPDWFIDLMSMRGQERDAKFDIDLDFRRNGAK
jgi:hypothetical protein